LVGGRHGLHWENSWGEIPPNAVAGGFEDGHPLYLCHGSYEDGVHPGKIVAGNCNIGFGGSEIELHDYKVLVWN
jgi:hypothetical protein